MKDIFLTLRACCNVKSCIRDPTENKFIGYEEDFFYELISAIVKSLPSVSFWKWNGDTYFFDTVLCKDVAIV